MLLLVLPAAAWPDESAWTPFTRDGVALEEAAGDAGGDGTDLAGPPSWALDLTGLYLRLPLAASPAGDADPLGDVAFDVWFDTDGDGATVERGVQLRGPAGDLYQGQRADDGADPGGTAAYLRLAEARFDADAARLAAAGDTWTLDIHVGWTDLATALGRARGLPSHPAAVLTWGDCCGTVADLAGADGLVAFATVLGDEVPPDADDDHLPDALDAAPADGDADDDGLPDGDEWTLGTDPAACDTDGDGLTDGLEVGVSLPAAGTADDGCFVADRDVTTTTDPLLPDSDGGGLGDGAEDRDGDGEIDPWETNPGEAADDADLDGDGVPDRLEGHCPEVGPDDDRDADGLPDALEGLVDTDGDGLPDFCDLDDDGDGLASVDEGGADTDGDGLPDARDPDADGDGLPDGEEGLGDVDCDGVPDFQDPEPRDGGCADPDADGLDNDVERDCGSDPFAADSDGDGVPDPEESCEADADCDLLPDRLDGTDDDRCGLPAPEAPADGDCFGFDPHDRYLDCGELRGGACAVAPGAAGPAGLLLALAALLRRRR